MRKSVVRFCSLALFFAAIALPAMAQETPPVAAPPLQEDRSLSDIPDKFFDEADKFLRYCESHASLPLYYNCECMGYEYLEARIKDPKISQSSILKIINKKCSDASGAAGSEYERCLGSSSVIPPNVDPEEYCTCYAKTYSKLFERYSTGIDSQSIVEMQTEAYVTCTDPKLGKQIYPYRPAAE